MRFFATATVLVAGTATLVASRPTSIATTAPTATTSPNATLPIFPLSSDYEFAFVLQTFMSLSNTGGASTGEILRMASQIKPGDFDSFYQQFYFMATKIQELGDKEDPSQNPVSVREAMFRASAYYRGADFFLHGNQSDPRINSLWDQQTAAFNKAISLLPVPGTRHTLPADGFEVPIIFYKAANDEKTRPTVIVGSGYDAAQEDSYHSACKAILDRDWNCVTYEGPGQPTVRRNQNKGFIPEWWKAVTPVVDYLHTRPEVDTSKIALMGISYGGLLAPLAASHEHRLAATVAVAGLFNLGTQLASQFPPQIMDLFYAGNRTGFDTTILAAAKNPSTNSQFRWIIDQGLWAFDTTSPFDWMTRFQGINMTGKADKITCPVFVTNGQDDTALVGQAKQLTDAIGPRATYHLFETEVGAGEHCSIGAESHLAAVTLGWLDGVFRTGNGTVVDVE